MTLHDEIGEARVRERLLVEARTWINTPWHHRARVKGAGVDCAQFVNAVYHTVLGTDLIEIDYPPDHFLHRSEEQLVTQLERQANCVPLALPGDVVVYRFGRAMSHAGLVVDWPRIIHAYRLEGGVVFGNGTGGNLAERERQFYRWKGF
ncbi:NlpC/P60 family protein [Paraburkholderia pallida]|uniref:Hydrolase n=1 Tax=Paraburkholderia pallida TaxID=2547399 RepID=A0A4P7CTR3_9BURK|nr:NlpC/P60 family protein [Paraburkholderia pallida]QBQ98166.1 hydrolase [Paraburkholderia pallida]